MKAKAKAIKYVIIALLIVSLFIGVVPSSVTAADEYFYADPITIINAQSYPTVGGNWTAMFNTTGTANLTITAINGTAWSNINENNDLRFLEVRCGEEILDYEWVDNSVFIENYSCDGTGYETSKVLTAGKHILEFDFGAIKKKANNHAGWWNLDWNYRKEINITNVGSSDLANFPAYLNISYNEGMKSDLSDLRFINSSCGSGSTELAYEIENYTASNAHVWVKIPTLSTGTTSICMYYNNSGASSGENATGVWDSSYLGVWHLSETSGNTNDSTSNAKHGTVTGATMDTVGKIDGGDTFDGSNDYIDITMDLPPTVTISAWAKSSASTLTDMLWCIDSDNHGPDLFFYSNNIYLNTWDGAGNPFCSQPSDVDEWHLYTAVIESGNTELYINGSLGGTANYRNPSGSDFHISSSAGYDWQGTVDEVRVSNTARSADWIKQTYQMVANQSGYVSFGSGEMNVMPFVTLESPSNNYVTSSTTVVFNCSATGPQGLQNSTLYHNITGSWAPETTKDISGTSNSTTWTKNNIPEGNYIWNCIVYDADSNSDWGDSNFTFTIDKTPPSITINSPTGTIADTTPTINVIFGETVDTAWYNIDHGENITLCTSCSSIDDKYLNLAESSYTIYVFANDTAGNVNAESSSFTIDMNGNYYDTYDDNSSIAIYNNVTWNKGNVSNKCITEGLGDGSDGTLTVASANTIINSYTYLTGNENSGDNVIVVNDGSAFSNGDEILIIQIQNGTGTGQAGNYEFRKIVSGGGTDTLTLDSGLENTYGSGTFNTDPASATQVVRVPQHTDVTVNSGASITAPAWNGYTGGIVVFRATGTVNVTGAIIVSEKGYRGGYHGVSGNCDGAQGESWTGKDTSNACYGYGAKKLPNKGGGGSYICGGGGEYGGGATDSDPWSGSGDTYARKGEVYGTTDLSKIFFGSGGGGMWNNEATTTDGGDGGGIIMVYANTIITAADSFISNGQTTHGVSHGSYTYGSSGGAGGSIYLSADSMQATTNFSKADKGLGNHEPLRDGGDGGVGRIRLDYNSLSGTTYPTHYAGSVTKTCLNGSFTSTAINTTNNITEITNITWTTSNTDANNNITVNISIDGGQTWYNATNGQGISGIAQDNSLVYKVMFATNGTKAISLLDINITWSDQAVDTTPPTSISNLQNTTGNFWINWSWDNPPDADFNYTMVFINGTWQTNVSKPLNYFNGSYTPHATKTISTHTVDTSGNVNSTWVNQTTTIPNNPPLLETIGSKTVNETETLTIDVNATDLDNDTLTYSCNRTDLFADFNMTTGTGSWTPSYTQAGIYYVDFGVSDGYDGVDNETVEVTVVDITPPAAITDLFAFTGMDIGEVYLTWTAPGDDGMNGSASGYIVRYSTANIATQAEFNNATNYTNSWTPLSAGSSESHVLTNLTPGTIYYFAIEAVDEVPNHANLSNSPNATVQNVTIIPASISLSAYPNSIEVGGNSSIISARVIGNTSQPYIGANVSFTTTLGYFNGAGNTTSAITNHAGIANVTLISPNNAGVANITAAVVSTSISDTTTVTFTPGPPAILLLDAKPQTVFANGINTSIITAIVKDEFENPIPKIAVTLSSFVDNNPIANKTVLTNTSGQASVELLATRRVQDVRVNASTDGLNNYTIVSFIAGDPYKLMINANPKVIGNTSYHVNKSTITALVVDEWYHALNGWEVNFGITNGNGTLDSPNATTILDGEAVVTLFASDTPGYVTVTATLAKDESLNGSITVRVVGVPFVSIETTIEPKSVTTLPANVTVTHTLTGVGEPPFQPVDVILTTDLSGSMRSKDAWDEEDDKNITRIDAAKKALKTFINISLATETTRVGLAAYGNSSEEYSDATWDKWLLPGASFHPYAGVNDTSYINPKKYDETTENGHSDAHIDANLTQNEILLNDVVDSYNAYGGTCIGGGINAASEALNLSWDSSHLQFIVIMSDGIPTMAPIEPDSMDAYMPSDYNPANDYSITAKYAAINASKIAQEKGITVYSIGFGVGADQDTLRAVASNATAGSGRDKNYFFAANSTRLQEIYNEIYGEIEAIAGSADVNVVLPGVTDVNITDVVIPNATYIPPTNISFFSYAANTTKDITHEPTITNNTNMSAQTLAFTIGEPIYPGDVVVISYTLLVNGTGEIINGSSTVEAGGFNQTFGPLFAPTVTGTGPPGFGNDPPVAIINAYDKVHVDKPIQFDGLASSDTDGSITSYSWDFNASDGIQEDAVGNYTTYIYSAKRKYTVTLTVTDNDGASSSATRDVTVFNMTISASPPWIMIQGQGVDTAQITVNATRDNGIAVDGVPINFNTTLGTLNPEIRTTGGAGLATVTLTSGDTAGPATIKATEQCSGAFVTIDVEIRSRGEITLE